MTEAKRILRRRYARPLHLNRWEGVVGYEIGDRERDKSNAGKGKTRH